MTSRKPLVVSREVRLEFASDCGRMASENRKYQLAGRVSTDRRPCIESSGQLMVGLVGIDSSVSVEHLRAHSRTEPK